MTGRCKEGKGWRDAVRCCGRYLCYLLFQLKTHSSFFSESEGEGEPALSLVAALAALTGITVVVAVCSECAALPASKPMTMVMFLHA
jgi:Ca2+/H+ antiporter